jgi:hypothetical protein
VFWRTRVATSTSPPSRSSGNALQRGGHRLSHCLARLYRRNWFNDPQLIAKEPYFVSINATTEVDLMGQAASQTMGGHYWSSSGGQAEFARGAMYSPGGKALLVLHSTTSNRSTSTFACARLCRGDAPSHRCRDPAISRSTYSSGGLATK